METKTIPFDLETAKKIQAGEIAGRITTKDGEHEMKIVCFNSTAEFGGEIQPIIAQDTEDCCYFRAYFENGSYLGSEEHDEDLVLEVPDTHPQFKVGDKVRVRPNDTHSHFVKQYANSIGKIVGEHHGYFVVIVTGAFQDQFTAEELELVEETGKHEFKPFDRVLVRNKDTEKWFPAIYTHMHNDISGEFYALVGNQYATQCIPYEGNEHLVGTTDKPTAD